MNCGHCEGKVHWQDCPTGGWWYHENHPVDNHEAEPHRVCAGGREIAGNRFGWTDPCPYEPTEIVEMNLSGEVVVLDMCGWHLHDCGAVPIVKDGP